MEGGQQSHLKQVQARLADQPAHHLAPAVPGGVLTDDLQLRPPAPVGTWLSTSETANHDARSVWAGGGSGASQVELERSLRKAVKAHRDAEIRLQLELQKKVELSGAASRMLAERELLLAQVEDIRGRLLEAKLQNVQLKNELSSRAARDSLGCRTCGERCLCCSSNRSEQNAGARGRHRTINNLDCQQACCFAFAMATIVGSMMTAFALTMEL